MRKKILILYYNFFVNTFLYWGLTLNTEELGGDVFINFTASGTHVLCFNYEMFVAYNQNNINTWQ